MVCILAEAALAGEDDEGKLGMTEDGQLIGLSEQAVISLGKVVDLSVDVNLGSHNLSASIFSERECEPYFSGSSSWSLSN